MLRRQPRTTRTETLLPYSTLFRTIQRELDRVVVERRRGDLAEPFLDAEATLKVAAEQLDGERAGDILGAAARRLAFPARLDAGRHRDRPRPQMEQVALDLYAPGIQLGARPGILRPRDIGDGLGRGVGLAERVPRPAGRVVIAVGRESWWDGGC